MAVARTRSGQIMLLTIYGKSNSATNPAHLLRMLKDEITKP